MESSSWGDATDKREGMGGRLRALDQSLTWVRSSQPSTARSQGQGWPALDRKMVDLHARFERACVEE